VSIDLESRLNLEADEKAVAGLLAQRGGRLHHDTEQPERYWLELHPRAAMAETYFALVRWIRYPGEPPSVKFATGVGGALDATTAWPRIAGYRAGAFDICMPFTAEGFGVHPDWRTSAEAWRGTGNPFLWVAETLQRDLNNRYEGRHE
jgi:hypothetical protein